MTTSEKAPNTLLTSNHPQDEYRIVDTHGHVLRRFIGHDDYAVWKAAVAFATSNSLPKATTFIESPKAVGGQGGRITHEGVGSAPVEVVRLEN